MGSPAVVFTSADEFKSISITGLIPLDSDLGTINSLFNNLSSFNAVTPLDTVQLSGITTKDGRSTTSSLSVGGPLPNTFSLSVSSTDLWTQSELIQIASLMRTFNQLQIIYGVTAITVTFN
jgi:hypothetical protein